MLGPTGDGTVAEVAWTVEMMQRPMRLAARVAHPFLRWGHDRVVEATVAAMRRHLAARSRQIGPGDDRAGLGPAAGDTVAP